MTRLALALLLLLPASTLAQEASEDLERLPDPAERAPDLFEELLRLPNSAARRSRLVQELSREDLDPLDRERWGTALSVLSALDADGRDDPYILRLFLLAATDADPEIRDQALFAARRNEPPPAVTGEGGDGAARVLLERKWLAVRGTGRRMKVVEGTGETPLLLSTFVNRARDGEIEAILRREEARSWGVFGGFFGGGFALGLAGGFTLAASAPGGFDGTGAGAAPDPEAARVVGASLVGVGVGSALAGLVHRAVVAGRHRRAYGRYYTEARLRELVDRRNQSVADELGVEPGATP